MIKQGLLLGAVWAEVIWLSRCLASSYPEVDSKEGVVCCFVMRHSGVDVVSLPHGCSMARKWIEGKESVMICNVTSCVGCDRLVLLGCGGEW
jgi:hypothetical protein